MAQNGPKTNERPDTRAVLRHARFSAYKAREVLNLIRGLPVADAMDELNRCDRDAGRPIAKLVASAVANAGANDGLPADELFVAACYADAGRAAADLGWRAELGLAEMCASTWHWQSRNPGGYCEEDAAAGEIPAPVARRS